MMSERDAVLKEIEKLQDEVQESKRKMNLAESRSKLNEDEVKPVSEHVLLVTIRLTSTRQLVQKANRQL